VSEIFLRLQTEPFDSAALAAALGQQQNPDSGEQDCGATVTFTGWVRGDGGLQALTLEHYPGMTEKQLAAIVTQACERWPLQAVSVVHRVGRLSVGEPIVFVGTASAHRQAAFEACAYVMDWLKTKAPFWKCEDWADGRQSWVAAKDSDVQAAARWATG
jgi:molybdopterin synthase catalytic subunit